MATKVCKKCGMERDIDLFPKKESSRSLGCRRSTCRICKSKNGILFSFYSYVTEEMNKLSIKNCLTINRKLRSASNTVIKKTVRIKICLRCNKDNVSYKKKICYTCRRKEDARRAKESETKKRIHLKDHYIKKQIKHSMKEYSIKPHEIPQDLIELKRKQLMLTRTIRNYKEVLINDVCL